MLFIAPTEFPRERSTGKQDRLREPPQAAASAPQEEEHHRQSRPKAATSSSRAPETA
jgi:hypothetical protein